MSRVYTLEVNALLQIRTLAVSLVVDKHSGSEPSLHTGSTSLVVDKHTGSEPSLHTGLVVDKYTVGKPC